MQICKWSCPALQQLSNHLAKPALQMGDSTCVRALTQIETNAYAGMSTPQHQYLEKRAGRVWRCVNISFSTAGGGWTCSVHQTSIKVSVWVMRAGSLGDQTAALPASRTARWPSVRAKKDQRKTFFKKKRRKKQQSNVDTTITTWHSWKSPGWLNK